MSATDPKADIRVMQLSHAGIPAEERRLNGNGAAPSDALW